MNLTELMEKQKNLEYLIQKNTDELDDLMNNTKPKIELLKTQIQADKMELIDVRHQLIIAKIQEKIHNDEPVYFSVNKHPDYSALCAELEILRRA